MPLTPLMQRVLDKSIRPRRHLAALLRYGTVRRFANVALVEAERMLGRSTVYGKPYMLVVDPVNICNLKCPLCPTGRGDLPLRNGKMKREAFEELFQIMGPWAFKLMLYNWGEPFLHKDILTMIEFAHKKGVATSLSTNLNHLPKGGAEGIVNSGLDDMIVSCDGLSQKTYARYRVGGNVKDVFRNLREIAKAKRRLGKTTPVIEFQFLVFKHNEHQIPRVREMAKRCGANFVRIMPPYIGPNKAGIEPSQNPLYRKNANMSDNQKPDVFERGADLTTLAKENPPPLNCFWPWRSMVINWNGQVDPCCFKNYHESFGNVFEDGFEAIWNGETYRYARQWISGKAENNPNMKIVCRGCGGYG
ncbi:MAG: SPASM domain-containing protein [Sumerlaeia bacterium]